MMPAKFILRFDDIAPEMAWSKFSSFEALAIELDIPLLVGVVPHCLDSKLAREPAKDDFWDVVRGWVDRGWTVAQHGYTHQYVTKNPGILAIGNKSELAGLSYEEQYVKLKTGKDILVQQGVWQPVFMASAHSFDYITLQALADLEFRYLTDGYGVYPYKIGGLTAVPQLFASSAHLDFGVYTICLHINDMTQSQIQKILWFVRTHRKQFISFADAVTISSSSPGIAMASRFITAAALRIIRDFRSQVGQ